ncbi:MAG TPA: amino acid adenylation domain-containing protein, partial [Thermoanaerobaculia bacterium]|nr:amino acid adenylation domain-containing protein [Thermoanaerobaculia bacterium]
LSRSPFFDVLLVLQNTPPRALELPGLALLPAPGGGGAALFDWTFNAVETGGALALSLAYSADLFEAPTAERALSHLASLVREAGAAPARPLGDLPLLSPAERFQLAREWNDTAVSRPGGLFLHGLVADQAARTPDAVAVTFEGESLTFGELHLQARRLARSLRVHGCGPEVRVGIAMERSLELVVALLGTLEAGAAYVPLDPDHPRERLALRLEDAAPAVIVAQERLLPRLPEAAIPVVLLDGALSGRPLAAADSETGSGTRCGDLQLAYVIFTSGSTGRPKASMLHHRGIVNRLLWMRQAYGVGPSDVVLQKTPFGFDVSVWELFEPLVTGGRLVMARPEGHRDGAYLADLVGREQVSVLHFVPSMLRLFLEEPDLSACGSVRLVVASGEALGPDLARRFRERLAAPALENLYGPTEASVEVTAWSCGEADLAAVPIGRPIDNAGIHLLDRGWQPVPIGVPGELWIGGVGVARGYLGRPGLTAERFVPDPFSSAPGARVYRSGDLARHRADGAVEFLGRVDQQVKVRGFRVEPGEVEAALRDHPAVRQAAVVARHGSGGPALVAYVVSREGAGGSTEPAALRTFLRQRLPEPMVPSLFVRLPALPLNASGKLDRRALPEPAGEGGDVGAAAPVAPRDPVEEGIAAIWREVLGTGRVGVHDVFFELGGHSLAATRVVSRVRAAFGVDLPLRALFEAPTVAGLGERVRLALRHGAGTALSPTSPPLAADPAGALGAPLSFAQQRLWFLHRLEPGSTVYNLRVAVRLQGDLDPGMLARAFGEVVGRHATLRTHFAEVEGEPVQVIEPAVPPAAFVLPLADMTALGERSRDEALRLAEELGGRPFDLGRGPLVRPLLLRLPGGAGSAPLSALLVVMHHVVSDAWSMGILVRELSALHDAFRRGAPSPLPELPVQYADFARWQRRWLSGEVLAGELAWWRERLAGLPARLDLPTDRPRPPVPSRRGAHRDLRIAPELGARVAALALREGATPFMVLLAVYQGLLARWSGQDDFAVGTPVAGRTRVEVEELIGFFINNLVLRARLGGEPDFHELLGRVRSTTLDAYGHQDLPFEKLVEELAPERSLAHSPIFQVVFGLQTAPGGTEEAERTGGSGDGLDTPELGSRTAKYDLLLSLFHAGAGFEGLAEYDTDLFDGTTVDRFLNQLETLLAAAVTDPGRPLADVPLLAAAERHQTLVEWNGAVTPYPRDATVHQLFEEQADRDPGAVAVVSPAGTMSYGELEARANRLAHSLRAWGVGPEMLVGLCLERSAEMVVAMLAILKAGGAYVPLDPAYPLERLAFLLGNAFMPVVLTEERVADRLPAGPMTRLVLLDADRDELAAWSESRPEPWALPENLVYVMYTSGSTGEPKGVAAIHRGVTRLVRETGYARFGRDEVFLQLAPVSFDASTLEIWGPLLNGGRLVVPEPGTVSLAELGGLLADQGVTTLWLTAGLFHEMADAHLAGLSPLRQLLAGGDVLSPAHVRRVLEDLPGRRVINGYGPTENTTFTCCHPMADPADVGPSVAIGRPIANTSVYLIDRRTGDRPVPPGVAGELAIGGDGLARGYLDRPDLTAERWRPDAASGRSGERLYQSGDLARYLADGRIEFLGRIDQQVKIRGFRIEPGEIEAALTRHPAVRESVVVAREDRPGDRRLVAYVATDTLGGDEGERELRSFLAEQLPAHMVPAHVVFLEALPLTPNGKVDRRALPVPGTEGVPAAGFVAPGDRVEEGLAAIWSEVLGRSPIGARDNFFELGGHSLLAVRVISQVRDRFGVELPLRVLFEEPTVASLARSLREAQANEDAPLSEAPPLRPLLRNPRPEHEEVFPLSFAQQRLWFLDRLEPGSALYNMPMVVRLEGALDAALLEGAVGEIIRRHETLRTTLRMGAAGGEPVQAVAPPGPFVLPLADLSGLAGGITEEVRRLVEED